MMILAITSIQLKSPWAALNFYVHVYRVVQQLRSSKCMEYKTRGNGLMKHYTMSLWRNEKDLREFTTHDGHLRAMRKSPKLASEIRTLNVEAEAILPWQEGILLLNVQGKRIQF